MRKQLLGDGTTTKRKPLPGDGTTTTRKPLLGQGESLLKKAISLPRLKPVLSSKRTVSDKLRDHHQRYQRNKA